MELLSNEKRIEMIIEELQKLKNDSDIEINFITNKVAEEIYSVDGVYAIMQNIIEITSKRPIKIKESDIYS